MCSSSGLTLPVKGSGIRVEAEAPDQRSHAISTTQDKPSVDLGDDSLTIVSGGGGGSTCALSSPRALTPLSVGGHQAGSVRPDPMPASLRAMAGAGVMEQAAPIEDVPRLKVEDRPRLGAEIETGSLVLHTTLPTALDYFVQHRFRYHICIAVRFRSAVIVFQKCRYRLSSLTYASA